MEGIRHLWRFMLVVGAITLVLACFAGTAFALYAVFFWPERVPYEIRAPIRHEIADALQMVRGENKFAEFRRMGFGGAGAGGLGAPQLEATTAQQFADLIPDGELVYTWWVLGREGRTRIWVKQVYWAFIENRAGILTWETHYVAGKHVESCRFRYMTETELVYTGFQGCFEHLPEGWHKGDLWENERGST